MAGLEKLEGEEHAMFSLVQRKAMLKIQNISHGYHEACEGNRKYQKLIKVHHLRKHDCVLMKLRQKFYHDKLRS